LTIARVIARSVRESAGGLPSVQARGMLTSDPNVVQVSTNLLDTDITPLHVVFEAIRTLALERGIEVAGSEIVGLVPLSVLTTTTGYYVKAEFGLAQIIQSRLLDLVLAGGSGSL
jgi:glutamate formiminotransferase